MTRGLMTRRSKQPGGSKFDDVKQRPRLKHTQRQIRPQPRSTTGPLHLISTTLVWGAPAGYYSRSSRPLAATPPDSSRLGQPYMWAQAPAAFWPLLYGLGLDFYSKWGPAGALYIMHQQQPGPFAGERDATRSLDSSRSSYSQPRRVVPLACSRLRQSAMLIPGAEGAPIAPAAAMHQPSASLLEDSLLRSKGHLRRSTRRRNADLGGGGGWIGLSSLAALLVTLVGSVLGFGLYAAHTHVRKDVQHPCRGGTTHLGRTALSPPIVREWRYCTPYVCTPYVVPLRHGYLDPSSQSGTATYRLLYCTHACHAKWGGGLLYLQYYWARV